MTRTLTDVVEGFYLAYALDALHTSGALASFERFRSCAEVARERDLDETLLVHLTAFVAARTAVLESDGEGRYRIGGSERALGFAAHMLDQYVGGYGPALAALSDVLAGVGDGASRVNQARHASAFAVDQSESEVVGLLLALGVTSVVDLGCGGAQTLCGLAIRQPELVGLGVDGNPSMVEHARTRVRRLGLCGRVDVACGDALTVLAERGATAAAGIQAVLASSVLNGYWHRQDDLPRFLRRLSALLPGRVLIASDYYGGLARDRSSPPSARTLIHDVAQIASEQGVPPATLDGWNDAYAAAGAEILEVYEAGGDGIDRFVHVIKLAG